MIKPIHPFPARMAPDLSRKLLGALPQGSCVLDPMCGSGTVIREAVEAGHRCVGRDLDPLAVLMTRAWVSHVQPYRLVYDAEVIVDRARALKSSDVPLPWDDDATDHFARYWFAADQLDSLSRLAYVLNASRYRSRDLLKVCFSRLVITKDRGASLARDVSHSRPHRVADENDFDVYAGFMRAARLVAKRLEPEALRGEATVHVGDARALKSEALEAFDAAITSPPYLNAIDYLRGHRLSLIWFGHSIDELQGVRSNSTGCERGVFASPIDVAPFITTSTDEPLADRYHGWIRRYARDMADTLSGLRAVVRPGGTVILVIGNSLIRGAAVDNAGIVKKTAGEAGLEFVNARKRSIPARRRYLPPPRDGSPFSNRMRSECVLTLRVPQVGQAAAASS